MRPSAESAGNKINIPIKSEVAPARVDNSFLCRKTHYYRLFISQFIVNLQC